MLYNINVIIEVIKMNKKITRLIAIISIFFTIISINFVVHADSINNVKNDSSSVKQESINANSTIINVNSEKQKNSVNHPLNKKQVENKSKVNIKKDLVPDVSQVTFAEVKNAFNSNGLFMPNVKGEDFSFIPVHIVKIDQNGKQEIIDRALYMDNVPFTGYDLSTQTFYYEGVPYTGFKVNTSKAFYINKNEKVTNNKYKFNNSSLKPSSENTTLPKTNENDGILDLILGLLLIPFTLILKNI